MKAWEAFFSACQRRPQTIGAAGWQLNRHVLALEEELGLDYASDVRGREPFFPSMQAVKSNCIQIPTTLPTLDEIIGTDGIDSSDCWKFILKKSQDSLPHGHVFTLHAELEGMKLISVMTSLLQHWQSAGVEFYTLKQLHDSLDKSTLPRHSIEWGEVDGRSGLLAVQGFGTHSG